jgi:long-chain-fatty-acid--CoA ligase ACSBG
MLSHDNLTWGNYPAFDAICTMEPSYPMNEHRIVSYLPLSHIAGLMIDLSLQIYSGHQVYFARPDALAGTLVQSLQWARPTIFFAVPRVWEKFEEKLKEIASTKPAFLQSISGWAKGYGTQAVQLAEKNKDPPMMFSVANAYLGVIKKALGLDKTQIFCFGAAPLKKTSVDYFASLNIPLFNMYGMSETSGGTTSH